MKLPNITRKLALHRSIGKDETGFTLLEVIIAISLLAVGLLAVASMQVSAITGNAHANRVSEATALAQDRLEELIADVIDTPTFDALASGSRTNGNYTLNWVLNPNGTPPQNTAVMQVRVSGGNLKNNVVLTSVIINPDF